MVHPGDFMVGDADGVVVMERSQDRVAMMAAGAQEGGRRGRAHCRHP
jgi:regulator of RNase E activity RraA